MSQIVFLILMMGVFWFVLIRPQVKRQKEHQKLLSALKQGDRVITRGGLVATIKDVSDPTLITLELNNQSTVRILRVYIDGLYIPPAETNTKAPVVTG